ncbi:immunity 50 family protein [Xanthomonas campestris pv. merremiae]|uniref:Imm50 family immunity protein n=1 Tax=Xanthomonas citri TaxID=346 RepID=UPI000B5CA1D0|nr:Imm50 family immunity protein [Xanthomonas citri]ASK94941.1 hypothetical protein XcvCFBP7112P_00180 [Xanthomonas citri pv. vignicola]MBV6839235.1 immunity 50 family protein [Xanthomonas campestris pv. merremiae]MBZ3933800.1 hypothetical protein [Xanthomonas campestris pv. merremiae]MCC8565307.1 immunity 50 family protein [Xanthomonas citri pv. fuscans]
MLLTYERPDSVRLDISYIDADQQKSAIVGLRFTGVEDLDLADLRTENVLDILRISAGVPMRIELEACYGLSGSFTCKAAEVTRVTPNKFFKPNQRCR